MKCSNGRWEEVIHKEIAQVFPGVPRSSPDSVLIKNNPNEQISSATLFLFYGHEFYECSVTGNDVSILNE